MDNFAGVRVNSKSRVFAQGEIYSGDPTYYEGAITMLFSPFLINGISDPAWQTLQAKLGRIIREIISSKTMKGSMKK